METGTVLVAEYARRKFPQTYTPGGTQVLVKIDQPHVCLNGPSRRHQYGIVRATLERAGTPIGANDTIIAAIVLANDCILVTRNVKEFESASPTCDAASHDCDTIAPNR